MPSYVGMAASDYHAAEALSASGAKLLLRSPAHYLASKANQKEPTAAMRLGTLTHALVLEPEKFDAEFAVMPKFDRRTTIGKKAAEEFEQEHAGKVIVDEIAYERARNIADAVRSHPLVAQSLVGGHAEVSLFWDQYGLPCKARCDYMTGNSIFDVKTCLDASPEGFARQIANFQYHLQAAHYSAGFREVVGWEPDRFVFIAVESEAPHAVGIYALDARSLQSGRLLMERAAAAYRTAIEQPAVPAFYSEALVEIAVPAWAQVEPFTDE